MFEAEGTFSDFDKARVCLAPCREQAFMLVEQMPAMFAPDSATARADRAAYAEHNVCFTEARSGGQIIARPNEHSQQCGCDSCNRHRRRAVRTETADKPGRYSSGKEVRL